MFLHKCANTNHFTECPTVYCMLVCSCFVEESRGFWSLTRKSSISNADFMTSHARKPIKRSLIRILRTTGIYILCPGIHRCLLLVNGIISVSNELCLPIFWWFETYNGHRSDSIDNGQTQAWINKPLGEVDFSECYRHFLSKLMKYGKL